MKILNSIQLTPSGSGAMCRKCACFQNDPAFIEETYRGLKIMSSGFASVRDQDGFCSYHELYLSARDSCPHFMPRSSELNKA
jgi:hypothetical protein